MGGPHAHLLAQALLVALRLNWPCCSASQLCLQNSPAVSQLPPLGMLPDWISIVTPSYSRAAWGMQRLVQLASFLGGNTPNLGGL